MAKLNPTIREWAKRHPHNQLSAAAWLAKIEDQLATIDYDVGDLVLSTRYCGPFVARVVGYTFLEYGSAPVVLFDVVFGKCNGIYLGVDWFEGKLTAEAINALHAAEIVAADKRRADLLKLLDNAKVP